MSVLAQGNELDGHLPPHPSALFGSLLHHVRENMTLRAWQDLRGRYRVFDTEYEQSERELRLQLPQSWRHLIPFKKTLSSKVRVPKIRRLLQILPVEHAPESQNDRKPFELRAAKYSEAIRVDHKSFGFEAWWSSSALGLGGYVDKAWLRGDGLVLEEYKSGRVERSKKALIKAETQLQLYELIARSQGYSNVERRLVGVEEDDRLTFDDQERAALKSRVAALWTKLSTHQRDGGLNAMELASVGRVCEFCDVRHRCSSYLESAPQAWEGLAADLKPSSMPLDAWGRIDHISSSNQGGLHVYLERHDGLRIQIERVNEARWGNRLEVGRYAYFFNLAASHQLKRHGKFTYPLMFQEGSIDKDFPAAINLQVFIAPS